MRIIKNDWGKDFGRIYFMAFGFMWAAFLAGMCVESPTQDLTGVPWYVLCIIPAIGIVIYILLYFLTREVYWEEIKGDEY